MKDNTTLENFHQPSNKYSHNVLKKYRTTQGYARIHSKFSIQYFIVKQNFKDIDMKESKLHLKIASKELTFYIFKYIKL